MINTEIFKGKVIIFSAPSGAGKTSIVHSLLNSDLNIAFSISACTRKKRINEVNGKDYYFISVADFKKKIDSNEFIEWEEVYKDNFYGTMNQEINRIWNSKKHVVFDVDVEGGVNLKAHFKEKALSIFISPPSLEELKKRLINRGSENKEDLEKRINKARKEMHFINQFDEVIINDVLKNASNNAYSLIKKFLTAK